MLDVIHHDVANAYPCVQVEAEQAQQRGVLHALRREEHAPGREIQRRAAQDLNKKYRDVNNHEYGGDALEQPVAQAVMCADNDSIYHIFHPISSVSTIPPANTQ